MSVEKIFWRDPYLVELEAQVTSVNSNIITLDKTIAFAVSGGQQSDAGTIGGWDIIKAEKQGLEIFYTLPIEHSLSCGQHVAVKIDWERRYKLMRLHFAAELVLELVYQRFNHPDKIGANISADKARVDFAWTGNISEIFPYLLEQINGIVAADLEIVSDIEDVELERRYWQIAGFAKVPCGGTHLKRTGEIGAIRLKRNNIGGGKERIEITLV